MTTNGKTLAFFLGTVALLAGFYLTLDKLRVTTESQLADRFTQAVDQLASENLELRLGGIYALERIARGTEADYWPVMEILTTYVRERAPWKESRPPNEEPSARKLAADIQAALTVLGRRERIYKTGEELRLDLRGTDLRRANLSGAHLEGAILSGAHLEEANLSGAHLEDAILRGTHLEKTYLPGASLERAFLGGAYLDGAVLTEARLEKAYLSGARFETANLLGADLTDAFGLTWEQVQTARRDNNTRFPGYLRTSSAVEPEAR
ncbi:MAG: pentapeptide repeat-containing protein [Candidatus Methylomirabilales bacterium]